jgi:hypothetical protein
MRFILAKRRFASRSIQAKRPSRFSVSAGFETVPEGRRCFALLNIPRHLFSEATAAARATGRA